MGTFIRTTTVGLLIGLALGIVSCSKDATDCPEETVTASKVYNLQSNECYAIDRGCKRITGFKVYDRWGRIVFELRADAAQDLCWMGADLDGAPLEVGVYFYEITLADLADSVEVVNGSVTVLM